jgi:hypothetical protein
VVRGLEHGDVALSEPPSGHGTGTAVKGRPKARVRQDPLPPGPGHGRFQVFFRFGSSSEVGCPEASRGEPVFPIPESRGGVTRSFHVLSPVEKAPKTWGEGKRLGEKITAQQW